MINTIERYYIHGVPIAEILDREHSEIKCKQQNLRRSIVEGKEMDQIIACSKDLIHTTLAHFDSEESAMEACNFEGLEAHKVLHAEMVVNLMKISSDLEHRQISNAMELMSFFDVSLAYHLDSEDGAFGRELRDGK
jgi:hemerythrin-like metal-binding protein